MEIPSLLGNNGETATTKKIIPQKTVDRFNSFIPLSKDHELLTRTTERMPHIAIIKVIARQNCLCSNIFNIKNSFLNVSNVAAMEKSTKYIT